MASRRSPKISRDHRVRFAPTGEVKKKKEKKANSQHQKKIFIEITLGAHGKERTISIQMSGPSAKPGSAT
jgi:hypothetical protein